jgi:hypothetical protein
MAGWLIWRDLEDGGHGLTEALSWRDQGESQKINVRIINELAQFQPSLENQIMWPPPTD